MSVKKIKSILKETIILDQKLNKDFGLYAAIIDFNKSVFFRKNRGMGKKLYFLKYENLKKIFYNKYKKITQNYFKYNQNMSNIAKDSNIYFFWWQGINENTPEQIIQNLNSVKKNCKKHKVVVLTKDNIKDYVEISDNIYNELEKGNITITHFSDVLRVKLLSTHGGIWSDASFCWTEPLPEYIYDLPIFSIKHGLYSDFHLAKGNWTVGFLASGENCMLYKYIYDMFDSYLKEYNYFCCYLLLDVYLSIAYDNWEMVKREFDHIPYNNKSTFFFWDNGAKKFDNKEYEKIIANTSIFRNHVKMKKAFETKNKQKTFYSQFYNDYLSREKL